MDVFKDKLEKIAKDFELTPKESKVLSHLVEGFNAKEIAGLEKLTYETARWYIKQIYQKTGVNRQVQLVRLLID